MANLIVNTPPQNVLVINQSTDGSSDNVITTNVRITDNLNNFVSIISVDRGLPGIQGPAGPSGVGIQGPRGIQGAKGDQGPQGPPGSGINTLNINGIQLSATESLLNIVGSGSTKVAISGSSSIVISTPELSFAPIDHSHDLSTLYGFPEAIDDRIDTMMNAGTGIYFDYNDMFNTFTINTSGLVIGQDIQPYSSGLSNFDNVIRNTISGDLVYNTGNQEFGIARLSQAGRNLIDDITPADQRSTLGLGTISVFNSGDFASLNRNNTYGGAYDQDFGDSRVTRYSAYNSTITASSYSILQSDNGKVLVFSSNSPVSVTVPTGVSIGFNCLLVQLGSGQVRLTGTQLVNRIGHTKLVGQYSVATLVKPTSNLIILSGDTTSSNS